MLQVGTWEQCGGRNAAGVSEANSKQCCASSTMCTKINDYYWQCKPGSHQATPASITPQACSINVSRTSGLLPIVPEMVYLWPGSL